MSAPGASEGRGRRVAVWAGLGAIVLAAVVLAPGAYETLRFQVSWSYSDDGKQVRRTRFDRWQEWITEEDAWFLSSGLRSLWHRCPRSDVLATVEWREGGDEAVLKLTDRYLGEVPYLTPDGELQTHALYARELRDAPWIDSGFEEWRESVGLGPPPPVVGPEPSDSREP